MWKYCFLPFFLHCRGRPHTIVPTGGRSHAIIAPNTESNLMVVVISYNHLNNKPHLYSPCLLI